MNLAGVAGAIQAMPYQRTSVPTECEQYQENDSDSSGVDGVGRLCDCGSGHFFYMSPASYQIG
jgi:hypothetical protein